MRTSNRHFQPSRSTRSRRVGVAAALLACFGLAACTAAELPSPTSTEEDRTVSPLPESGDIDAGTYLATLYTVPFEITVPDGWWTDDGSNLGKNDPDDLDEWRVFLTFWPADFVPTDACAWQSKLVHIDPTAQAFVDAMAAQASTVSTPAVEVVVGDYPGFEFEHSVESDVDITECDGDQLCIYSEEAHECGRWYSAVGEHETYRVVDLNGDRAVIAVGQFLESINPALRAEARAVFDSIVFIGPDE